MLSLEGEQDRDQRREKVNMLAGFKPSISGYSQVEDKEQAHHQGSFPAPRPSMNKEPQANRKAYSSDDEGGVNADKM
jgi:hypothetical protein